MKRSRKRISLLCVFALLFILSLPVSASSAETATDEKVQDILSRVLKSTKENNLFGLDEVSYVMTVNPEIGEQILSHLNTITISVEAPSISSEELTSDLSRSNRPRYSVEYNGATGEERIVYENEFYLENSPPTEKELMSSLYDNPLQADSPQLLFPDTRVIQDWYERNPQNWSDTSTIFKLYIQADGLVGTAEGTAFMIGDRYLATSGHVLYNETEYNGWAGDILCIPAYKTSQPQWPLGHSYQVVTNMAVGGDWKVNEDNSDDWGVLQLKNDVNVHEIVEKRCVGDTDNLNGEEARIAGYPINSDYNMYVCRGIISDTWRRLVSADYVSAEGMSGSPISDGDGRFIGIHCGSLKSSGMPAFVKFDQWIYNKLRSYE